MKMTDKARVMFHSAITDNISITETGLFNDIVIEIIDTDGPLVVARSQVFSLAFPEGKRRAFLVPCNGKKGPGLLQLDFIAEGYASEGRIVDKHGDVLFELSVGDGGDLSLGGYGLNGETCPDTLSFTITTTGNYQPSFEY